MIYLHYVPVEDVDFLSLLSSSEVRIIVPRITVQELDKQKDNNPARNLRDRARRVLQKFEDWFALEETEIRASIFIEYFGTLPNIDFELAGLDKTRGDDQLIASIIQYRNENPETDLVLVTQDTGPKLTAKDHGIATLSLPDSLKLTQELDPLEKENLDLRKQLEKLKTALPKPNVCFIQDKSRIKILEIHLVEPHPYPKEEIEEKIRSLREQYQPFDASMSGFFSQEEVDRYNSALPEFFKIYAIFMERKIEAENDKRLRMDLRLELYNEGTGPANDLDIMLRFPEYISLIEKRDLERMKREISEPKPPKPPKTKTEMMFANFVGASGLSALNGIYQHSDISTPLLRDIRPFAPPTRRFDIIEDDHVISAEIQKLKHNESWLLPALLMKFSDFESAKPFSIDYVIRVANLPDELNGKLFIKVEKDQQ
ncbi:MAG: PIN domain-containing protein [Thermoleophilia bacterium]